MGGGPAAGAGEAAPLTVAAFDFDGTLVAGDSLVAFLGHLCGARPTARALASQIAPVALSLARSGRPQRDETKARILARLLAGRELAEVEAAGASHAFALAGRVRPAMRERLRGHQGAGHRVVIVSASPEVYLGPLGRLLGVDAVLATRLEVGPDGRLTGRIEGANCRGAEKALRLQAWLGGETCTLHAYGDSAGDAELLAMADVPTWVGRRARSPLGRGGGSPLGGRGSRPSGPGTTLPAP